MRRLYQQLFARTRQPSMDAVIGLVVLPMGCIGLLTEAYFRTDLHDAQDPKDCNSSTQQVDCLLHKDIQELQTNGIVVIENVLCKDRLRSIQHDIETSLALQTKFDASGNGSDVRQDKVQWVQENNSIHSSLDYAISLVRGIAQQLETFDGFFAQRMRVPRNCQLAIYPGDSVAGYERHVDRCTSSMYELGLLEYLRLSDFRTRVVTVILYLNEPNRGEEEGGALRYWDHKGDAVDIFPKGGKLVVFDASRIHHQVLPSATERTALTCWITGVLADEES